MAVFDKNIRILMLKGEKGEIGDAGDYSTLQNKPKINNVTLSGSKSASDLGLVDSEEIDSINADIGTLENLSTTTKTSLVNAINEVNGKTTPVTQGGTGLTSLSNGEILIGNGTDPILSLAALPVSKGGTGGVTAAEARVALGLYSERKEWTYGLNSGVVTLTNANLNNFDELVIFYFVSGDNADECTTIKPKDGVIFTLDNLYPYTSGGNPAVSLKSTKYRGSNSGSNATLTPSDSRNVNFSSGSVTVDMIDNPYQVYKVVGYKY